MNAPSHAFFGTPARMFDHSGLTDIPTITARCVEPDARLVELLAKDAPLTAAEWVEITAFEREAS